MEKFVFIHVAHEADAGSPSVPQVDWKGNHSISKTRTPIAPALSEKIQAN
ncbi:hypothetical protein [Bacillus sp. S14(2024)]